jgi:redox-sensitive bicupin YhaK (pirin superfamily)
VHVARGALTVNGEALAAGDAAMIVDVETITLEQGRDAEVLLFDLGSLNA